jgi:hypothetical protein
MATTQSLVMLLEEFLVKLQGLKFLLQRNC